MPCPEQHSELQPLWEEDQPVGIFKLGRADHTLHLHLLGTHATHYGREHLLPGSPTSGQRLYILGRPYIQEPDYQLSVDLYSRPDAAGAIGRVRGSTWSGLRRRDIGRAQAWTDPAQRVAILWECYLNEGLYTPRPVADDNLNVLWQGFERAIINHSPEAERIFTPSWEDLYDLEDWHAFLNQHGYQRFNDRAFTKEVGPR